MPGMASFPAPLPGHRMIPPVSASVPQKATRLPRNVPLPLSYDQERLWFLDRLQPGSAAYNVAAFSSRISGRLDEAALEKALGEIVRRHEALRTRFPARDGKPVQVIAPELDLP